MHPHRAPFSVLIAISAHAHTRARAIAERALVLKTHTRAIKALRGGGLIHIHLTRKGSMSGIDISVYYFKCFGYV